MIEKNLSAIIFISQSFVVSLTKTVVYIVHLITHRRIQMPVNGMKASDFKFTSNYIEDPSTSDVA